MIAIACGVAVVVLSAWEGWWWAVAGGVAMAAVGWWLEYR